MSFQHISLLLIKQIQSDDIPTADCRTRFEKSCFFSRKGQFARSNIFPQGRPLGRVILVCKQANALFPLLNTWAKRERYTEGRKVTSTELKLSHENEAALYSGHIKWSLLHIYDKDPHFLSTVYVTQAFPQLHLRVQDLLSMHSSVDV